MPPVTLNTGNQGTEESDFHPDTRHRLGYVAAVCNVFADSSPAPVQQA